MLKKIQEKLENISSWIWENVVDPHLIPIYKDEEFTGELKANWDYYVLYWLLQYPIDTIYLIYYRIFVRGYCAINGCDIHYYRNDNLPDDCREWACENCGAEGINHVVQTIDKFYNDTPFENFIQSLKGK